MTRNNHEDTPERGDEAQAIAARLCVWRIFGVGHDWTDRPSDGRSRTLSATSGPEPDDETSVVVGDIPPHVLTALTDWQAYAPLRLDAVLGGGQYALLTPAERETLVESSRARVSLEDVKAGFPLWVTVEVSRPLVEPYQIPQDSEKLLEVMRTFGLAGSEYLSAAMSRIFGVLGSDLKPDRLVFADTRAYLLSDGSPAVTVPQMTGTASMQLTSAVGWESLPFDEIQDELHNLPTATPTGKWLKAARFLWKAMEHQHRDTLSAFLFASVGLEVLANQEGSALRTRVVDELNVQLGTVPIGDLILPDDGKEYNRSVLFRFACLATIVSRATASEDVAAFRELQGVRNKLAHGDVLEAEGLPANDSITLLQRYVSLVALYHKEGQAKR